MEVERNKHEALMEKLSTLQIKLTESKAQCGNFEDQVKTLVKENEKLKVKPKKTTKH